MPFAPSELNILFSVLFKRAVFWFITVCSSLVADCTNLFPNFLASSLPFFSDAFSKLLSLSLTLSFSFFSCSSVFPSTVLAVDVFGSVTLGQILFNINFSLTPFCEYPCNPIPFLPDVKKFGTDVSFSVVDCEVPLFSFSPGFPIFQIAPPW